MILTRGFWGKEAWRPPPKWNTRFFFVCSKRTQLYLRFEGNMIFFGMVGKKVCPVGCLSLAKQNRESQLGKLFSLPSQRNFPISSRPKVVHWENAKEVWYYEKWVGRHISFPPRQSVKLNYSMHFDARKVLDSENWFFPHSFYNSRSIIIILTQYDNVLFSECSKIQRKFCDID